MLSISSCDLNTDNGDSLLTGDVRFILREDMADLSSISVRVKHNGSTDVMWVILPPTTDLTSDPDELIQHRVETEYAFTYQIVARKGSNKSVHFNKDIDAKALQPKVTYRIIVKPIDSSGKLYGKAESIVVKTRRDPDVWEENKKWTLTRNAERTQVISIDSGEIIEYENFSCECRDSERYIVLPILVDDWNAYEKDPEHGDKMRTLFEDYHKDFISGNNFKSKILTGNGIWKEERLRSGDYVLFMIGLDEDNELSGLYRKFNVTIKQEEMSEDFSKWLGTWEVSFPDTDSKWIIYISNLDANMWYHSQGWEPDPIEPALRGLNNLKLYFDKGTGKMYMTSQEVAYAEGARILYYGTFKYGTSQVVLDMEEVRIASVRFTDLANQNAIIEPTKISLPGVGEVEFSYSLYYIEATSGSIAASASIPKYPWKMRKISDQVVEDDKPEGGNGGDDDSVDEDNNTEGE